MNSQKIMPQKIINEAEYRQLIQQIYDQIEKAFSDVDPDLSECEQSLGAMTIKFSDDSRCILSAQPSVRQLWVAVASLGRAYHFNYDRQKNCWLDDKGQGIELISFLQSYLKEKIGMDLPF